MVKRLVVDTSVIIKWLSKDKEDHLDKADRILIDVQNRDAVIIAPELAKYEVGNVLLFSKKLSLEQAQVSLSQFFKIPLNFISDSEEFANQTYQIAKECEITYYDASFLSVAEQLGAALVSDNVKHHGRSKKVKVIPLKDY